jgi:hypothetical protein
MIADPWVTYGYKEVMLGTTRNKHSFSFAMTEPTDSNARIAFDVGASTTDVTLDNIILTKETNNALNNPDLSEMPQIFCLTQNYPNPFNPVTTIQYQLSEHCFVSLKIYDLLGKEVAVLVHEKKTPGVYTAVWNGADLASGIYFYRLQAGDYRETRKLVLQK